jgi:tryptophanyl-tRNA synthetase
LALQQQGDAFLFIADYHALTSVSDPQVLRQNIQDVALDFLACGLDTRRTVFFRQSDVPEVLELTWLLSIVTPMGLLERCHSFKDKTTKGIAASHALFSYPVLMAADILEVQATTVPVGRDQKQHVEVARDIAVKFNLQFGETFAIPEPVIREDVAVVPGLDGQKMSKSYNNTIELFGTEKDTKARIMRIVTDSTPLDQPKDPAACHIFALYKLFASDAERAEMDARYRVSGFGYGTAKKALFEKVWSYFEPFRKRREELRKEPAYVEAVLKEGAERARVEARKTLSAARRAVGLE